MQSPVDPPPSTGPLEEYGQDVFMAERIVNERVRKIRGHKVREFLIKWEGFDNGNNTWEPEKNIFNKKLIDSWRLESSKQKKSKRSLVPILQTDVLSNPVSATKKARTTSSLSKLESKSSGVFQIENLKMIELDDVTVLIIELILS